MTKRKRRQFTAEFKPDAVKLVRTGGESIAQTVVGDALSRHNETQQPLAALEQS